jgi:hypothetical protein
MSEENQTAVVVQRSVSVVSDCLALVSASIFMFRAHETHGLERAVQAMETAYLESYMAWGLAPDNADAYRDAHEKVKAARNKMLEVKKLLDELECEAERALQSVHSLRP